MDHDELILRIQQLKPCASLDFLRKQIAGRSELKAEVRQLREELEARMEKVASGELPPVSTWELQNQINARMNTLNIDYEQKAMNTLLLMPDARQLYCELKYELRMAREQAIKPRMGSSRELNGQLEVLEAEHKRALRNEDNKVVSHVHWTPEHLRPEVIRRRELVEDYERKRAILEQEIQLAEEIEQANRDAIRAAEEKLTIFRRWVCTGRLEEAEKPESVTEPELAGV
jgi:hypothetical protein